MPRLYSIFDTNVYRKLSPAALEEVRQSERKRSVQPIASPWVCLELLARAAAPGGEEVRACRAALVRLVEHCRTYNGSQYVVPIIGIAERQVSYSMLGGDANDELTQAIASHIGEVVEAPHDRSNSFEWWAGVQAYVHEEEQRFEQNIWLNVIKAAVPEARTWNALIRSQSQLQEVLTELDSNETLRRLANGMVGSAPSAAVEGLIAKARMPLQLCLRLIREVLTRGLDLSRSRNRNTIWDMRIALATVMFSSLDPRRICLVTDDQMVLAAARATGCAYMVISLTIYRGLLADPTPIDQHFYPQPNERCN